MMKYIRIYLTLIKLNFSRLVIYQNNLPSQLFSSFVWGSFLLVQMLLLTSRTKFVFGWSRQEILLLVGSFNIIIGLFHVLFSRSFARFSIIIDKGDLDLFLLKPVDSQFLLSTSTINLSALVRVTMGIIFNIYIVQTTGQRIYVENVLLYIVLMFAGIAILYSIWFAICTLMIWFTKLSNLVDLLYTLNGVARFPPDFVNEIKNIFIIFLLPLSFVVGTPTQVLLDRATDFGIMRTIVTAVVFVWLSRLFWKKSLRYYTSASS